MAGHHMSTSRAAQTRDKAMPVFAYALPETN
jgi:hypothetical protein